MLVHFKNLLYVIAFSFLSIAAFSQEQQSTIPKWYSDKGYWVVESNIYKPLDHIIRFYDNDNILLYKEVVTGMRLDPTKRNVKMKLKQVLETNIVAWQQVKAGKEKGNYVAMELGGQSRKAGNKR